MSKKNSGKKSWLHQPSLLIEGHVVYQVKLLGTVTVESPKGADLVKEAIRKVKFNLQLQKARGEKPQKVELTISMTAIGIQEKQNKIGLHSFPLQHISYCADDKSDKKICAFIARNDLSKTHECFVLESEKAQAEDITLTVGQAFDIAYQKYKENLNKDPNEAMKKLQKFQEKIRTLETENKNLRARVAELEEKLGIISTVDTVNEKNKERTESTSSTNSVPVLQLESYGGNSSTDPVVDNEFFSNIFGPSLEGVAAVNGTANQSHSSNQPDSNGVAADEIFESPQPQVKVEIVSDSAGTPVLAPPPRPTRQKRRQPPPSVFDMSSANNNEIKITSPVSTTTVPSVKSSNPFQDSGDWTLTQPTQPSQPIQPSQPTQPSPFGDLLFDTQSSPQQPKTTAGISFDDLDPLAGL